MKKYILLLSLFCSAILWGQDVTESMAVDVGTQYYERVKNDTHSERINSIRANNKVKSNRAPELISPLGLADMWLIPVEDGWVLVSSSTKTTPILAHLQTEYKPVYDSLAPGEKYLLNWYEHEIAYANDSCSTCKRNQEWDALLCEKASGRIQTRTTNVVSPLLHTHWDQTSNNDLWLSDCDKVYNKYCPIRENATDVCGRAPAGCVAVAMAQIMAYWQWPYATLVPTTIGGPIEELQFYDWSLMPGRIYNYSPDEQVNMIAGLLRDCGYRVNMDYQPDKSGAYDSDAVEAFKKFGYNENTIFLKEKISTSGWQPLLQAELDAGRPVYYAGCKDIWHNDGHAFVLDGYDSDGKFHINFGWGDSPWDGFYQIDTIAPYSGTNFNYWQAAIIGIQPAPYCGSEIIDGTVIFPSRFSITAGGELVFEEKILENIEKGDIFSATQIKLTNGFTIKEGCNVHIAIRDVPCPPTTYNTPSRQTAQTDKTHSFDDMEQIGQRALSLSPNPVTAILHLQTAVELSQVKIYSLNGLCVLLSAQTDIDVSSLSQGMYILCAVTSDGTSHQAKFIKE